MPAEAVQRQAIEDAAGPARDATVTVVMVWRDNGQESPVADCEVDLAVHQPVAIADEPTAPGATTTPLLGTFAARTDDMGMAQIAIPRGDGAAVVATSALGGRVAGRVFADGGKPLRLVIQPRMWVRGQVLDVANNPIVDADIEFLPWSGREGALSPTIRIGCSDHDGRFAIPLVRGGLVSASHPRFGPAEPEMVLLSANASASAPESLDVVLHLIGRSAFVSGTVVDAHGRPASGAQIELRPQNKGPRGPLALPRFVDADERGMFSADRLHPGPLAWSAIAAGSGPAKGLAEASVDQRLVLRIVLPEPCRLRGVLTSPTGQPIANATVSAHCPGTFDPRRVRTAADGSFAFDSLAPGKVVGTAEHANITISETFVASPEHETVWNAVLGDGDGSQRLGVLLVDTAGAPLAGWNVRLAWAGGRKVSDRTGSDGTVDLPCLDPAPADAFVHAPETALSNFADARFGGLLPSRERQRLIVDTNARRSSLTGRAISAQLTEGRAEVALWHHEFREYASAIADGDGSFHFARVPAGTLDVVVRMPGHAAWSRQNVVVVAGEPTDLGTLTLQAAGAISGSVVGPDGQPPTALEVCVVTKEQRLPGVYSGGVYRIDDVPAGKHRLLVQGPGIAGAACEIEIRPGVAIEHNLQLDIGVNRRIQIDVPPQARGYVSLTLRRKDEPMSWVAGQQVATSRTAEFLACMSPGDYEVTAWGSGGHVATGTVRFTAGDDSPVQFALLKR